MPLKTAISVEVTKNEHVYQFNMPLNVPLGEAYDAAFEVLREITDLAKKATENAQPKEEEKSSN